MAQVNVPAILPSKTVGARITAWTKRGSTFMQDAHDLAVQCLLHAHAHNDVTLADRLVRSVPGVNNKGLRFWFTTFGAIAWNGDGKVGVVKRISKRFHVGEGYDEKGYNLALAVSTPFWTMKENEADQAKEVRAFSEDNVIKAVFNNQHSLSTAVIAGKFTGDSAKTALLLGQMEALLVSTFGETKVKAIKADIEAKNAEKAAPPKPTASVTGNAAPDEALEQVVKPAVAA